jgi:predicted amidohydrolase
MCENFSPNIATLPMPPPFAIALPMPEPSFETGNIKPPKLKRVRCATDNMPTDTVRIAVANLAVQTDSLEGRNNQLPELDGRKVKDDVRLALQAAESNKCDGIVFPEYSLPSSMQDELQSLASRHNIVIIAGLEGQWVRGKVSDQAIIAFPGEQQPHYQRKQEPSLDEELRDSFYRDGEQKFFTNSPIGEFAVIVCSDFLQLSALHAWTSDGPIPELFFVVARNPYPELYKHLAIAEAVRFYAGVIIANVCATKESVSNDGSCVIVPQRDQQIIQGRDVSVEGSFLKTISIYEISLRSIRARTRGKPDTGYLAVPNSAKRG